MIGIVAMNPIGCIGANGGLPWHHPEDLAFFKRTTLGGTLVMGRVTWDSLPRRPLPGRDHVVLTRDPAGFREEGAIATTPEGLEAALVGLEQPVFVIGGAQIYDLLFDRIDEFLVTRVLEDAPHGDTFFPRALSPTFHLASTEQLSPLCTVERWRR
jgi:dihydrofolate reductase